MKMLKLYWTDLIVLLGLLLAGYKYTFGLQTVTDIGLFDETIYLANGFYGVAGGSLPVAEGAPLYAVWYFLLSLWQPDALALYYLNYQVLTTAIALVIYLALRSAGVQNHIAIPLAFLYLLCYANLPVWPKVSHFALIVILLFFSASFLLKSQAMRLLVMLFGALLASYVRPEFFLATILLAIICVGVLLSRMDQLPRHNWSLVIGVIVASSGLLWGLGIPMGEGRSFVAFAQHFAWHWVEWTDSSLSPWTDTDQIIQQVFGDVDTIGGALLSNPVMFSRHLFENALLTPIKFTGLFFVHAPLALRHIDYVIEGYLLLAGVMLLLLIYHRSILRALRNNVKQQWVLLWTVLCYSLPGFVSALIIQPRTHYLLTAAILLPIAIVRLLVPQMQPPLTTKWVVGMVVLGLLVTPATPAWYRDTDETPRLATINLIASLAITEQVNMLEAEGGYDVYLGENFTRIPEIHKSTGFNRFSQAENINMIILTEKLKEDSRFVDDPEWQVFLQEYAAWGYIKMLVPYTAVDLLVDEALLVNEQVSSNFGQK